MVRIQPQLLMIVCIIAFIGLQTLGARAEFQIVERTEENVKLRISGRITANDANALQELLADLERKRLSVELDSTGGDVRAAMQIGRLVRKYDGDTLIGGNAKCHSSCALIFIAGVSRMAIGDLGLHRPYLGSEPQKRRVVETHVPLMLSQVKQYVQEMGITDNFYQEMVNTEPSKMIIYDHIQGLAKLVPFDDPVHQEIEISYAARRFGVTTSEMRQRDHDAEECGKRREIRSKPQSAGKALTFDDLLEGIEPQDAAKAPLKAPLTFDHLIDREDCKNARRWGLSELVYKQRQQKIGNNCALSQEERKVVNAISKKERRDHPLWIRAESCERSIMLSP